MHPFALILAAPTFRQLLSEQTTPLEVVNFVLVTIVIVVACSALAYSAIIVALWAVGSRDRSFRELFLPTGSQFLEWLGNYGIGLVTTFVVGFTFGAKHDLVEAIAAAKVTPNIVATATSGLSPLAASAIRTIASGASAEALISGAINAGRDEEATNIVQTLMSALHLETPTGNRLLIALCLALIAVHLVVHARRRLKNLQTTGNRKTDYGATMRALVLPAVCIALLLTTATLASDQRALARSVVAALKSRPPVDPKSGKIANAVREALRIPTPADINAPTPAGAVTPAALSKAMSALSADQTFLMDSLNNLAFRVGTLEARGDSGVILIAGRGTYPVNSLTRKTLALQVEAPGYLRIAPGKYVIARQPAGVQLMARLAQPLDTVTVNKGEIKVIVRPQ